MEALGHAATHGGLFLQRPQRAPQCVLDGERLLRRQRLARVRMTDTAAESNQLPVSELPQNATALGTGIRRGLTRMIALILMHRQLAQLVFQSVLVPIRHGYRAP